MRTEGDYISINEWLKPLSWLYGIGVRVRNWLYDAGVKKSHAFDIPVIAVGNITVGGSGKTPHVEYLIRLLKDNMKVAVLSRGYKRKSKGYRLASADSTVKEIGDEPYQMLKKFNDIYIAVDKKRCHGIERLQHDEETKDVDVILLDDAFQHRAVKPGINILLVDYHRLIIYDKLLPAGRLREPKDGKARADIVIVTKCPHDLKPMEFRVLTKALDLYPYQDLFFTAINYLPLTAIGNQQKQIPLEQLPKDTNVLLLTGIASPRQIIEDMQPYCKSITPMSFADHHQFSDKEIDEIKATFSQMPSPKMIVTTEKDATRLPDDFKEDIYILPITIKFLLQGEEHFNTKITSYVLKNSRNSILAKTKNDHKSTDRHNSGNRPRTISFRNN